MRLKLSEKDFKLLIKLIHLGKEKFTEPCLKVFEEDEDVYELEKKIVSQREDYGFKNRQEELNLLLEIKDFKDKWIDNLFWEELIKRLTQRDIIKKHDLYFSDTMTEEQKDEFLNIKKKYSDEFYENGLNRIKLDKDK